MAKKTKIAPEHTGPMVLTMTKAEFRALIEKQIKSGKDIVTRPIRHEQEMNDTEKTYDLWNGYNQTLLESSFAGGDPRKRDEYSWASGNTVITRNFAGQASNFRNKLEAKITCLETIQGQIDLYKETPAMAAESLQTPASKQKATPSNSNIFVVHGHDRARRNEVEIVLRQLSLEPIILENKASGGLTIIEKLERDGKEASYAVIIATADDEGHTKGKPDQIKPRARQNVVLELGAFIFALGRKHVAVLCDDGLEHPSDIAGLVYITLDAPGTWKHRLGRELQHAGFDVDLSKLSI